MPKLKSVFATPEMEACRQALLAAIKPYADKLGPAGMLAVASGLVGQLIAMQDRRSMTEEMAKEIVRQNIESANAEVIARLRDAPGGRA